MQKVLELEVPEENLVLMKAELAKDLGQRITSRQEAKHYPLIRLVIHSEEENKIFVNFLQRKLESGELDRDFVILEAA